MEYTVSWTEENWYRVNIEADSIEEAEELFWSGEFDSSGTKNTNSETCALEIIPADEEA